MHGTILRLTVSTTARSAAHAGAAASNPTDRMHPTAPLLALTVRRDGLQRSRPICALPAGRDCQPPLWTTTDRGAGGSLWSGAARALGQDSMEAIARIDPQPGRHRRVGRAAHAIMDHLRRACATRAAAAARTLTSTRASAVPAAFTLPAWIHAAAQATAVAAITTSAAINAAARLGALQPQGARDIV